ncbi:hypothetical protein [Fimbriiglobus ruber]|uniref:Uncharacterized protein n=1 Tax=Fimbriiglobus ruber TaxID=1908690 RepID=A0A225DQQ4_9BACT|nr:hypothetical protein [Fimbriiglobus ruber]OWK38507.1 hypothetical protein FRUB_07627 [Fimbriiglobus ruber]
MWSRLQRQCAAAQQRIADLEKQLPATTKLDEPYPLRSEDQRQQARSTAKTRPRKPKGRHGRVRTADAIALAERPDRRPGGRVPPLAHAGRPGRL